MCVFNLNAMFFVNFWHCYLLCFCGRISCNKKIVNFRLLAVLLYIFSARVDEIPAHTFLIHVHNSSFIMHSFSLTVNDRKCIPIVLIFGDSGHSTPTPSALWWPTVACWLCLGTLSSQVKVTHLPLLGYAKTVGRSSYHERQQCH
jgi:hypothetical protein